MIIDENRDTRERVGWGGCVDKRKEERRRKYLSETHHFIQLGAKASACSPFYFIFRRQASLPRVGILLGSFLSVLPQTASIRLSPQRCERWFYQQS